MWPCFVLFSSLLYDSNLNIFRLWTTQDIWGCWLGLQKMLDNIFQHLKGLWYYSKSIINTSGCIKNVCYLILDLFISLCDQTVTALCLYGSMYQPSSVPELCHWIMGKTFLAKYYVTMHLTSDLLDIRCCISVESCILFVIWILELRLKMCFLRSQWPWSLTFDH